MIKKATNNVPLALLMTASNKLGHGMGPKRSQTVLEKYPNLLTNKWTKKEFVEKGVYMLETFGSDNKIIDNILHFLAKRNVKFDKEV